MTGSVGRTRPDAVALSTPTATVGIRGTDLEIVYQERPGRKICHCTLVEATAARRDRRVRALLPRLAPGVRVPFPRTG